MMIVLAIVSLFAIGMTQPADSAKATDNGSAIDEKVANVKGELDGLNESYADTKATVDALKKIKVSGYIQAQYLGYDVNGVNSTMTAVGAATVAPGTAAIGAADGATPYGRENFMIKRGRLKTTYDAGLAQYVLELDATETGVGIKDAYVSFAEPWLKSFKLTMGSMDRPFGYEVSYSSSTLEMPERTKMIGQIFPKEKDLGAMIEFAQEDGPLSWFNFKGGVYNGMTNITDDDDNSKDLSGRAGVKFPMQDIGLSIDGGVSGYFGWVTDFDATANPANAAMLGREYQMSGNTWSNLMYGEKGKYVKRNYYGADVQLNYATPFIGGSCIKAEYIQGYNPSIAGKNDFYGNGDAVTTTSAVYERQIQGYYVYLIQNIDPVGIKLVARYDNWDPNTKVSASDFTTATTTAANGMALTSGDLSLSTWGFGIIYYLPWASNVKLQLSYEIPRTEKLDATKLLPANGLYKYTQYNSANDLNLTTLRVQFQF